jgi:hypothetical protein
MRVALYWVPTLRDPLFAAGTAWLGRDAETGAAVPQPEIAGIREMTADARRYGLHATLRPPMQLATGWEEFCGAAQKAAEGSVPFGLPPLRVCDVDGFLALRETGPCPGLQELADRCVIFTDKHRLRPGAEELARRRAAGLTARQDALLEWFGYPYVLDEWFFHVTLTRRLDAAEMARVRPLAEAHFAAVLDLPRRVEDISIFTQMDGDFLIAERVKVGWGVPPPPNPPSRL